MSNIDSLQKKKHLLSFTHHEMDSQLTAVKWQILLLQKNESSIPASMAESFKDMLYNTEQALRLSKLTNDLFRIWVGPISYTLETINLKTYLDKIFLTYQDKYREKNIKFQKEIDPDISCLLDHQLFHTALDHLIHNSAIYSDSGSIITCSLKLTSFEKNNSNQNPSNSLKISISDNGWGIPKEEQSQIFNEQFRGSNVKDIVPVGGGFGLSIVKRIMDLTGGSATFFSEIGRGTSFSLLYPASGMIINN